MWWPTVAGLDMRSWSGAPFAFDIIPTMKYHQCKSTPWVPFKCPSWTCPRKDRYNKKLDKFLVVVEERDSEVSDLEECERHEAVQDNLPIVIATVTTETIYHISYTEYIYYCIYILLNIKKNHSPSIPFLRHGPCLRTATSQ